MGLEDNDDIDALMFGFVPGGAIATILKRDRRKQESRFSYEQERRATRYDDWGFVFSLDILKVAFYAGIVTNLINHSSYITRL